MKILILGLGSYRVKDTTGVDPDNFDRQLLYAISIKRLCQIIPAGTDILIMDNTMSGVDELSGPLKNALSLPEITQVLLQPENQLGEKNKGAGEYGMCRRAYEKGKKLFDAADWVIYYTHRHPIAFPLVFEYIKKYSSYEAIVSNASYIFPDGSESKTFSGVFDDLIFAMKRDVFIKYLDSMNPELLVKNKLSSEQNLFSFLTTRGVNYKQVEHFGVFRYNYFTSRMEVV